MNLVHLFVGSQDPNIFWDLLKNEISRRSFTKISTRSNSSEDLRWISSENLEKIFRWKDFKKIWIKTFSSKNLQKIFILRSLKDLQLKSFWHLWKIFDSNLLEIFERSSIKIFLRSTKDLLVFVLIFNFKIILKNLSNNLKWPEDLLKNL